MSPPYNDYGDQHGDEEHANSKLNSNSYISLTIVGLIVAATLWIRDGQAESHIAYERTASDLSNYKELQKEQEKLVNQKLDTILDMFKVAVADRFSAKDAKVFSRQLKELNPNIKVPEIP